MVHNREFAQATRNYSTILTNVAENISSNPQRALDMCSEMRQALVADTRLKGHKNYVLGLEMQVDVLDEMAKDALYNPQPIN